MTVVPPDLSFVGLARKFSDVLESLPIDGVARDGDCLVVAPRVTAAVREIGIAADTVTVIGWLDPAALRNAFPNLGRLAEVGEQKILAFSHQVTTALGWVLDATAQQFGDDLPERWIAPLGEYLQVLAAATRVAEVTVAFPDV